LENPDVILLCDIRESLIQKVFDLQHEREHLCVHLNFQSSIPSGSVI
jgi:hypothetical protein